MLPLPGLDAKLRFDMVVSESPKNTPTSSTPSSKRIAILVVAYNAASTLRSVLDRIPESIWERVEEVMVFDNASEDNTYLVAEGYKTLHGRTKLSVFRNDRNYGYGGNQIRGYTRALQQGYDIVAMLHGDGQYAPELLPEILAPLEAGEADAVFGSRMLTKGGARGGGMPLYKYIGNRALTHFENSLLGMSLSEYHSGYRAYSTDALRRIPFTKNTNDFHFDTQIIIQLHAAGMRIVEIPIPTHYGDEICHVNGMRYARDVVRSVLEYEMHELGLRHSPEYEVAPAHRLKRSSLSSHSQLMELVGPAPRRVLDVGCGTGELGAALRDRGHHVTGVDLRPPERALDEFVCSDPLRDLGLAARRRFHVVVLSEILPYAPDPMALLREVTSHLEPRGTVLVSVPNAVHWSVRAQILLGRFDYMNKGILDRGHLRFFTKTTAERLFGEAGLRILGSRVVPVPWEQVLPPGTGGLLANGLERSDYVFAQLLPNGFAYQYVYELVPVASASADNT